MKISIIGCGNMGLTYARSFLQFHKANDKNLILVAKNHNHQKQLKQLNIANVSLGVNGETLKSDVIILAVKPQDFNSIVPSLRGKIKSDTLVISILAGIKLRRLKSSLRHNYIVRAMPNMPAQYGMGITAYTPSQEVNIHHISTVENLLSTTGRTFMIEDENLMDAVTAVSGSGPAYFYFFASIIIETAKKMGFDESIAMMLVMQTMYGAYHVMNNSNVSFDYLINKVASKGGTTEAAFNKLKKKGFAKILEEAIREAEKRSKELSSIK